MNKNNRTLSHVSPIHNGFIDEGSLEAWISQGKIRDPEQILSIAIQLLERLSYDHRKGLIHKDINPGNCLISSTGGIKIKDRRVDSGLISTDTDSIYIPPEQKNSKDAEIGPGSDIYSFGIILYELCRAKRNFENKNYISNPEELYQLSLIEKINIPEELAGYIAKCLKKKPEERFQTSAEARDELIKIYKKMTGKTCPSAKIREEVEMIYIPEGSFASGNCSGENSENRIYLYSYYIDRYPVTRSGYNIFLEDTGHKKHENWNYSPQIADYPVTGVTWEDANAYAQWAGKRLPSEAEWEKAAGGTDRRIFPWGNEWDKNKCNNWNTIRPEIVKKMLNIAGKRGPLPAGSIPEGASPYGVMDMAGNVSEWTSSQKNKENTYIICKGGSWRDLLEERFWITSEIEVNRTKCSDSLGFRCVKYTGKK